MGGLKNGERVWQGIVRDVRDTVVIWGGHTLIYSGGSLVVLLGGAIGIRLLTMIVISGVREVV